MKVFVCPSSGEDGKLRAVVAAFPHIWSGRVLDVGCRSGRLRQALRGKDVRYCGLDLSPPADVIGNLEAGLPFPDETFDVVVALDVLEHTDNIWSAFRELCRVTRRYCVIALPNMYEMRSRVKFLLGRGISGKYGLTVEPEADRHRWLFSFREARTFVHILGRGFGFRMVDEGCLVGPARGFILVRPMVSVFPNLFSPWYLALLVGSGEDRKVRVCFLGGTRYSQPLDQTGERKFSLLGRLGELFVIGFSQGLRPCRFTEHAYFYLLPRLPLPVLRYAEVFTVGPVLALWLILRRNVRVLVAQSPYEGFAAAVAKLLARGFGRRAVLIVENHGDFEVSLFLQRRVRWRGFYRWFMQRTASFALRHADLLRAVSGSTRRQLEACAPGKPVVQFPAWTDIETFLEAGSRDRLREPVVLYAGALIPGKGVHHLLGAFARVAPEFPEAQLEIVGREENREYAKELHREVERLGLDGRVSFVGEVPQAQLAERMRRACVFVLPSLSEGLGRVVVEAMATGTPVVASRVGGIPEVVQDGLAGFLVPPGDEAALAERLRWVLGHPREAEAMGRQMRELARSFFSPEAYLAGYQRLFEMAENIPYTGHG